MLSFARKMLTRPKQLQEFSLALQAIRPIMVDPQESRDKKREALNMMVNELQEKTFKLEPVAEQIMTIINMKAEVCKEYPDTASQVNGILGWLPRMKLHQAILLKEVERHRKEYGLQM